MALESPSASSLLLLPSPLLPVLLGVRRVLVDVGGLGGGGGRRGRRLLVQGQLVHHGGEGLAVLSEARVISAGAGTAAAGVDSVGSGVGLKKKPEGHGLKSWGIIGAM